MAEIGVELDCLEGVKVVDFCLYLPGPYCTRVLADLGAEVVKVEPPRGDLIRGFMPGAYEQLKVLFAKRRAYASMMATRPQTLYGLADSPIGLAAWLLDHGDGYGQPAAAISACRNRRRFI